MEELKAKAIANIQETLNFAYMAKDEGDEREYKRMRGKAFAKMDLYEAMFEGEFVYYDNDTRKVYVEVETV